MGRYYLISRKNVSYPKNWNSLDIGYDGRNFFIVTGEKKFRVEKMYIDKQLQGISAKELKKCMELAYLSIKKIGDAYTIRLKIHKEHKNTLAKKIKSELSRLPSWRKSLGLDFEKDFVKTPLESFATMGAGLCVVSGVAPINFEIS